MNAQSSCGETLTRQEKQRVPPLSPSTVYFSIAGSFSPQQVTFPRFSFCVARKKQECYSPIVASRSLGRGSSALGWEGFLESAQPPVSQGHLRSAVILGLVGVLFKADKSRLEKACVRVSPESIMGGRHGTQTLVSISQVLHTV